MATNTYPLGWVYVSDSTMGSTTRPRPNLFKPTVFRRPAVPNYYGPHTLVLLRIAIRDNLPNAQVDLQPDLTPRLSR